VLAPEEGWQRGPSCKSSWDVPGEKTCLAPLSTAAFVGSCSITSFIALGFFALFLVTIHKKTKKGEQWCSGGQTGVRAEAALHVLCLAHVRIQRFLLLHHDLPLCVFSKDVTTPATLGTIVGAGTDHKKIILTMAIRFSITPVAKGEGEDADEC